MTTKTTIRLTMPALPRNFDLPAPVAIAICIFALLGLAGLVGRIQSAPAVVVQPTAPLPIIIIATPRAEAIPIAAPLQVAAAPAGNVTKRAIVVYGGADLASAIGAVEPGRMFTPVAHYGADWLVVDMDGSGRVYVRVADLYDLPAGLVDWKPAPAPQVIYQEINRPETSAEYPAAPLLAPAVDQSYQVSHQPPAAPQAQPAPTEAPAPPPPTPIIQPRDFDTNVEAEWARQQWAAEHCVGGKCWP